jgi:hypothetical protein
MKNPKFRRASLKLDAAGLDFASSETRLAISFTTQRRASASPILDAPDGMQR